MLKRMLIKYFTLSAYEVFARAQKMVVIKVNAVHSFYVDAAGKIGLY
jgi:hypothetical protein